MRFLSIFCIIVFAILLFFRKEGQCSDSILLNFGPTLNGNTNPKTAGIGYEIRFNESSVIGQCRGIFSEQLNGACSALYSASIITPGGVLLRIGAGPAWVFRTDDRVSSHFNFNLEAMLGFTAGKSAIGACLVHYSNAGLPLADPNPNLGRDFATACIAWAL